MEAKQLELFDRMPKTENKTVFTQHTTRRYVFIDTKRQLKDRIKHTLVVNVDNGNETATSIIYEGYGLVYQTGDSKICGISINTYNSISILLKKKGYKFNKKTCQLIIPNE